jgi:hypothetical protein
LYFVYVRAQVHAPLVIYRSLYAKWLWSPVSQSVQPHMDVDTAAVSAELQGLGATYVKQGTQGPKWGAQHVWDYGCYKR